MTRRSVEVFALVFFLVCTKSYASTGPKWSSSSSSWNQDEGTSHQKADYSNSNVSPFSPTSHNIAIDVGQVFLMGDLSKYSDTIGTQLHYTYGVSDLFGFDSSLGYSQHSDGKLDMFSLLTGLRMNMSWYDKVIPYATFGLGFYRPNYQDNTVPNANSLSSVLFGVHLGPGVDLELSKNFFFGAAIIFHSMFSTTRTWANGNPATIGGTYTSFFLHIGATI